MVMPANPTQPVSPLQYLQTLSVSPFQGSNLPMVLRALSMKGSNIVPPKNVSDPFSSNSASNQDDSASGGTYGGYNYSQMAPGSGLTAEQLAQAAQAGAQSGLTQDPTTGNVY